MLATKSSAFCLLLCMSLVKANVKTVFDDDGKDYEDSVIKSANIHKSLMTVVSCDIFDPYKADRRCNVTLTNMQSKKNPIKCEFVLKDFLKDVTGHPFTANKSIVITQTAKNAKEHYAKYTIINFPECETSEAKIQFDSHQAVRNHLVQNKDNVLINDDDTFDVLYNDPKVYGNKVCRLTFDAQGKKVRGPIATSFAPSEDSVRRVKKVPSSSNFIVMEMVEPYYSGMRYLSFLLNKPNEQVVLKGYSLDIETKNDYATSTSQGVITICAHQYLETSVYCDTYNENGESGERIFLTKFEKLRSLAVENLPDGKFILLIEDKDYNTIITYTKNDAKFVGAIGLLRPIASENYSKYDSYIDYENDEICVTRRGFGTNKLRVLRECFGDNTVNFSDA